MANRNFRSQFHYSWSGKLVSLLPKFSFGMTGAPTLVASTGMGISSISRVSAGLYDIFLSNPYASLVGLDGRFIVASGLPASPVLAIVSDSSSSASAPKIRVQFSVGGIATDPASGEAILMEILFSDSSAAH